jgi:hypothetical protein
MINEAAVGADLSAEMDNNLNLSPPVILSAAKDLCAT